MMASRKRDGGGDDYDDDFDDAMDGAPSSPPSAQELGSDDEDASGDNGEIFLWCAVEEVWISLLDDNFSLSHR